MFHHKVSNLNSHYTLDLDSITDGIWEWNLQTNETYYSPSWKKTLGYKDHDISNNVEAWKSLVHPDDIENVITIHQMYIDRQLPKFEVRYRIRTKNNTYKLIIGRGTAIRDNDGKALLMVETQTDITQHIQAEEAFRYLFNRVDDPIFVISITDEKMPDRFTEVNKTACTKLGYCREELLKMSLSDIRPKTSYDEIKANMAELWAKKHHTFEAEIIRKDGTKILVEFNAHLFNLEGEDVILSIAREITERKRHERILQESEARYRKVVEACPSAIYTHDGDKISYINEAGIKLLGGTDENDLLGETIYKFIHPRYRQAAKQRVQGIQADKNIAPLMEQKMITLDGRIIDVEVTTSIYHYNKRDIIITFVTDITKKKRAFKALKESEQRYAKVIELSPDAIIVNDQKKVIFSNKAALKLLGLNHKKELIGTESLGYIASNYKKIVQRRLAYMKKKKNHMERGEIRLLRKDGSVIDVEIATTDLIYKGTRAMLSIVRDISERKETEKQLNKIMNENENLLKETIEYDRLKTEFFSNISHELRTPLNIILSAVQIMETRFCTDEYCKSHRNLIRYISMLKQNCYRLLRLINNLIDITRYDSGFMILNFKTYDLVSIIEDITLSVAEFASNKGIDVIFDTDIEEKPIACDADVIERIILNLLSNAIKFTDNNGKIEVNVFNKTDKTLIAVKDSGFGIPEEKLDVIFERFRQVDSLLTRKREGSGIGLALVKTLVEAHGGRITVKSEVDKGSEFILEIPDRMVQNDLENSAEEITVTKEVNVERIHIEFSDIYY